jgi:hypothetical protein
VIFSSVYLLVRSQLACLMVLARREVSRDAELLAVRQPLDDHAPFAPRMAHRVQARPAGRTAPACQLG